MTVMKWRISGQRYKHLIRFSRFVLFEPAASTMQFIYIYLLLSDENHENRISKAGEKISPAISLFFLKMIA